MKKIVIALGGNALQEPGKPATAEAQLEAVKKSAASIADLIQEGYQVVITHGNGPQVGRIVIQNELAAKETPAMPFDVCGAMSQGMIGYHIQQALGEELVGRGIKASVVSLVTQVVVNKEDPAFKNPTKPIGPFYAKEEADILAKEKGYVMKEDSGRGYRRVVASPKPEAIIELEPIKDLIDKGCIVVAAGGGGVPVIKKSDNKLEGVAAVIDKDLASSSLAKLINADLLVILTAVDKVAINFGKPNQEFLSKLSVSQARQYMADGQFGVGSMLPKVEAALDFVSAGAGKKTLITSLEKVKAALTGKDGTVIE